jgi:putative flippase GtrA
MIRFAVALAAMMAMNTLLFGALQGGLKLHYLLAQAITTILLIPPGYLIHRHWVFR